MDQVKNMDRSSESVSDIPIAKKFLVFIHYFENFPVLLFIINVKLTVIKMNSIT